MRAGGERRSADEQIMRADWSSLRRQLRPQASMDARGDQIKGKNHQPGQQLFDKGFASGTLSRSGPVHSMKQFRRGDGADCEIVFRVRIEKRVKMQLTALAGN